MRAVGCYCVAILAACYAPIVPTGVACPDGVCPNGQSCVAGFCDGAPDDGGTPDVGDAPDGPPADASLSAGWAVPTLVPALSGSSNDWGPSISADDRTLYLNTDGPTPGQFTIYVVVRATPMSGWGSLAPVSELDLAEDEYHADISIDGKELVYAANLPPAGLRRMTRGSTTQQWIGPMPLNLDAKQSPSLFANDLRLIVNTTGMVQEYSRTDANGLWTFKRNHSSLNQHRLPAISADGLEIYTIRNGRMYRATREMVEQPFGTPSLISFGTPFDTYQLFDPEISADGRTMYLSVDTGSATEADIYITTR